jgi:predicted DNA-binding transcriptional regulator YafY
MNRIDRLMGYMLLFQSRGLMRAQDFAKTFEISERTVYRDVQALSEVGVPIVAMPGEGYRLMEGYYLPPITFSPAEARSLYLALSMLAGMARAGPTQQAAGSALEKIRSVLPAATQRQVEALQAITKFYSFPNKTLNFDDETFLKLQEAIQHQRVVHLRYHAQHNNEVSERDVEPHELVFVDKVWLLMGYCRLRQSSRAFRLERIDALRVRNERFTPRPLDHYGFQRLPIRVVVRFDPAVLRWVRERQHYSLVEDLAPETDHLSDTAEAVMVYAPTTIDQIEGWLLSWGDKLEILEPAQVRHHLAALAERIAARHRD